MSAKTDNDAPLRRAAESYAPFDARETRRLRQFVADVEELAGSAFFRPQNQKLTISARKGEGFFSTLEYPGARSSALLA